MSTGSVRNNFQGNYQSWKGINRDKIYRSDSVKLNFSRIRPMLEDFTLKLDKTNEVLDKLSDDLIKKVTELISQSITDIAPLGTYDDNQFKNIRDTIYSTMEYRMENLLELWPQILAVYNDVLLNINVLDKIDEIKEASKKAESEVKRAEGIISNLEIIQSKVEKKVSDTFQKNELMEQGALFMQSANKYKEISWWWLGSIISFTVLLILGIYLIIDKLCFELICYKNVCSIDYDQICVGCNRIILYFEIIKAILFKIFIISIFVYILNMLVKNYYSAMHNYTINMHKANSLNAALYLIGNSTSDDTKNSILVQASNAIFTHQPTGYNSKDVQNVNEAIVNKVIDKLKP